MEAGVGVGIVVAGRVGGTFAGAGVQEKSKKEAIKRMDRDGIFCI
jgi:hypothetical protein